MDDFPEFCIRGIQKSKHVNSDDTVQSILFRPDNRTSEKRADKGQETSINWDDNETVLEFTLDSKDEDNPNALAFPHGAVRLARTRLDDVISGAATTNMIFYERDRLEHNEFHGNIVFNAGLPDHTINMIASTFA